MVGGAVYRLSGVLAFSATRESSISKNSGARARPDRRSSRASGRLLASRVAPPRFFEMDDEPPAHLIAAAIGGGAGADNAEAVATPPDVD